MAMTFNQLLGLIYRDIGDSSDSTTATYALNAAQRAVGRLKPWTELLDRKYFVTSAAYSTGTVAVTFNSTTVTLSSGTWPSDVASGTYRFQLSVSDPFYSVATRSSDTVILLAQAYQGSTDSSTSYLVSKPHYSLDSTVDRVREMWLHDAGRAIPLVNAETDQNVTQFLHYASGPGTPCAYLNIERDASGYRQVLLGPATPDAIRRVEYSFVKKTTDGTWSLDDSRWPCVLSYAKALLYERDNYERSLKEMERFRVLLQDEWASTKETEDRGIQVGQARVAYPQGDDPWLSSLPDFGTTVTIT